MKVYIFILSVLIFAAAAAGEDGYCTKDGCDDVENLKSIHCTADAFLAVLLSCLLTGTDDDGEDWSDFKKKISIAMAEYVPCKYQNCSCFTDLVKEDLKPFKTGITRDMLEKAKARFHYCKTILYFKQFSFISFVFIQYIEGLITKSLAISSLESRSACFQLAALVWSIS